jgi:hypothetical protein
VFFIENSVKIKLINCKLVNYIIIKLTIPHLLTYFIAFMTKSTLHSFLAALGSKLIPFKNLCYLLVVVLFSGSAWGQVTVTSSGGNNIGNGSYTTLGAAFTALGTTATGTIIIDITGNTSEVAAGATLAAGAWTSVTIAPTGGPWTISGAATAGNPLILFNGSDNVTINGGNNLIFSNTTVSSNSNTSTLRLLADATNNTFNNVTFLTAATMAAGTNGGAVFISTGTTTGNDNNSFQSCKFSSSTSNSGVLFYANGSTGSTAAENSNVTVNNCEFYDYFLASGTQAAIYISTGNTAMSITNNKIYQTATRTITTSSTVYGIYCLNAGSTALGENFTITGNTIGYNNNAATGTMTYAAGTTSGAFIGILFNHSNTSTGTSNINSNIVSNIQWTSTSTSAFTGISSTSLSSTTVGNTLNMNSNQVKNITLVTSTGQITGILSGYSPAVTISNNTIDNITRSGAGIFYAINYSGAASSVFTFNLNTISNLSVTSTSSISAFYGIYSGSSPATETWTNNTIDGLTSSSTASNTVLGIWGNTATTGNKTCQNNIVKNISLPASSTGTAIGIRISYLGATNLISGNTVHAITGGTNIYGMIVGGTSAATTTSVYKNKIYGLSNSINAATIVYGLALGLQGTSSNCHVYNNFIGDLTSSAANSTTDAVRGISITSASSLSNINLFYNTVYLTGAASSSTDFATSALFHTYNGTSTTASLTLKNNIFVNNYPSKGAGVSAAFKRSASTDLNNYSTSSDNNLFNGTNIYYDGTNTDLTMTAFKARVTTREAASFSENPTWVSTTGSNANFLHIDATAPTQIESGGTPISTPISITDDYDADTRNVTTPDVGADEGTFTVAVPMSYTSSTTEQVTGLAYAGATNQSIIRVKIVTTGATSPLSLTSLTLNANGTTDIADINAATAKVYYTGASTTFGTSSLFGATTPTVANFTVTGSKTLVEGNNYFWLAYDVASAATSANLIDGECIDLTVGTLQTPTVSAPSGSKSILGAMSGTYAVGASQTENGSAFTKLTTAIADLNLRGVSGAVTFALQSDYSSASETFPLTINAITGASGTNTITIKPAATVTATISGSVASGALIKLNGADYVTIDGSNSGGTDRSLTITNTATAAPTAISLISLGTGLGATNNTIKNCNISTGIATTTGYGIAIGGSTPGTSGADNDNVTIQNNNITVAPVGIYAIGNGAVTTDGNDNLSITNNSVDYNSTLSSVFAIKVGNILTSNISNNNISLETTSTSVVGISLETGANTTSVSKNKISKCKTTSAGSISYARGIVVGTASATSQITITNNLIYNVATAYGTTNAGGNAMGIMIGAIGTGTTYSVVTGGIDMYFNSVNLSGTYDRSSACTVDALFLGSAVSAINLKNNAFKNSTLNTNASGSTSKSYAIYCQSANTAFTSIDYNDYYVSGAQGILGYLTSDRTDLVAGIQAGFGQNVNSLVTDPLFNSNTNLIPQLGSPVLGAGTAIGGITIDYLGTTRNNPPTIGAYETAVDEAAPVITYTALNSTCLTTNITLTATITDASGVPTAGVLMPRIYYKKDAGAWFSSQGVLSSGTATNGTWTFTIVAADMGGVANPNVISYYVIAQDVAAISNITSNPSAGLVATDVNTVSTAPTTPNTYLIQNSLAAGTYTVGSGQTYTTLTAAVAAYNTSCLGGAIVFSLMDASYAGETFPITINANADASATNTLTIKPASGVTATISGSAASSALIKIASKYVTIDGSNTAGGTTRDLTITNTSTTTPNVILIGNSGTSTGTALTNVTLKNTILINGVNTATAVIVANNLAAAGYFNTITIQNNSVQKAYMGIYANATVASGNGSGLLITGNDLNTSGTNALTYIGIYVQGVDGATVSNNNIANITSSVVSPYGVVFYTGTNSGSISGNTISALSYTGTYDNAPSGIISTATTATNILIYNNIISNISSSAGEFDYSPIPSGIYISSINTSAYNNKISNIKQTNLGGEPAFGINLSSASTTSGISVYNNFIFDIAGYGYSSIYYNGHGIGLLSGGGYNLYNNTINMNTNQTLNTSFSSAIYIYSSLATEASVNIRNNIFANTQTGGAPSANRYAIYSAAANTIFGTINHNDYYSAGTNLGYIGSTARVTLADIVTGFGGNANSISALPTFTSATDMHLSPVATSAENAALKAGTYLSTVLTDYDGETRNTVTPAIGADEIFIDGFWSGAISTVWDASVTGNWDNGIIPASGVDIVVPAGVTNSPVLTSVSPTIGKLNLGSGKTITLGSNTLTVNGAITGTGTLTGSATSSLVIGGTAGTLNFTNESRTLKDLTLNSSTSATLGTALNITAGINSGTLIVGTGATLSSAGNLTLKSNANGTAKVGNSPGTVSGNVTVERYIPAKRGWRLLTAPLKGSSSNTIGANWQGTANEGLLLFSPATYQSTTMTGYTTGGGSPNIWNYDNGWQKIANISTEILFNTNNSDTKAYLVFATGPHGSSTIANTTTPVATTLKPVGQLITGSVAHSLTANQFKLLPNPYASPLNTAGLVTSNSGTTIWMVDPTLNTFGGYFAYDGTNWTPTTPSASDAYIQSGQGFFVKNAANTTFTIAESHKVSGNSNTWFERTTTDTSVDKIRVLLYKQDNNTWQLADGVLAVNSASGNHEVDAADADKMTNFNENLLFKNGTSNLAIEYRGLPAAGTLQPMQLTGTSAQPYELRLKTENYSNSNLTPYLENTQTGVLTEIPTDGSEVIVPFTGIAATSAAPDSRFRIVYQSPLSADDLNSLVVGVYPNPVQEGLFTIELANTNAPASYSLTNLLGQEVQKGTLMALTNTIPVHDLSEGVYLLQINQEGKRFTTKLMIK